MSWKQYSGGGGFGGNPVMVGAGAAAVVLVLVGAYIFADVTGSDNAEQANAAEVVETTIPRIVVPPDARSDEPFYPPEPGEDYVEGAQEHQHEEITHSDDELPDYSEIPIPPDQFAVVFPQERSNLVPTEFAAAKAMGAGVVTALVKGTGREQYPTFVAADAWPDPISPDMVVDFSYAQAVRGQPQLVRTVVVWHDTSPSSAIAQVRVAQYLRRGPDGSLTPVQSSSLPREVRESDGLLQGVSILR